MSSPRVPGPRTFRVAAVTALVPAAVVAGWALIGDLSSEGFAATELDYARRPPELAVWESVLIGVGVGALAVWAVVVGLRHRLRRTALVPSVLVGLLLAGVGRVATAGVVGANIGYGLALLLLLPTAAVLLALAVALAWRPRARRTG